MLLSDATDGPWSKRCASRIWILLFAFLVCWRGLQAQSLTYPASPAEDVVEEHHGTRVADPYRWLEQSEGPRAAAWLEAQSRLTRESLARIPGREDIRRRLTSLSNYARTGVPWREAGRIFYVRNTGLQPQSVLYMQKSLRDSPRVVLDPNRISPDGSIAVRDYTVSPDGRLLVYQTSRGGADVGETHLREISTGRDLDEVLFGAVDSVCWTRDGRRVRTALGA
jgi:prolyl oligopeptidase